MKKLLQIMFIVGYATMVMTTLMVQVLSVLLVYRAFQQDVFIAILSILLLLCTVCMTYIVFVDMKEKIIIYKEE